MDKAELQKQVIKDLKQYKKEQNIGDWRLGKLIGCTQSNVSRWLRGQGGMGIDSIQKCIKAGLTSVKLPPRMAQKVREKKAVQTVLEKVDNDNKVPRIYKRKVIVPPLVTQQIALLIDEYVNTLMERKTMIEFAQDRAELIRKVYYLCRQ